MEVIEISPTITNNKATICLNMIVKDESHIIKGTLEMLCSKIKFDYWVICDTGSSDNTPEIIVNFFKEKNIQGELYKEKWVNFAHNRTSALEKAYGKTDLLLVFDADDELHGEVQMPMIVMFDEYHMKFGSPMGTSYTRVLLINNRKRFRYLSVIHEFISCQEPNGTSGVLEGDYYVVSGRSGSRNKDPDKYLKDALVLEKAHAEALASKDPLYQRYAFYCANSYKDCGKFEEAVKWYKITLDQDNWAQEKYVSCLYAYDCLVLLKRKEEGFFYLVKAFQYDIERVECLFPLLVHYCCDNMNQMAYNYYLNVKTFFETKYLETDMTKKLFINLDKGNFFVPYYMILIADKVKDFDCVLRMYEIVFLKKQRMFETWYIKNFLYNLQFFTKYVKSDNFFRLANEYIRFLKDNNVPLYSFDFLKDYEKYGINIDGICNIIVTKDKTKFSKNECFQSKNILIYVGFSETEWNYSYIANNALGGSEKAVAYLSRNFPKEYNIYVSGDVKAEQIDNIQYIHLRELSKLCDTIPFHTVICSRYIAFLEMFQNASYYQFYIWAHDTHLIPYGYNCNLSEGETVAKWDKYIDGCVCQTEWHVNEYKSKYPQLKDKMHIINNGINTSLFPSVNKKQPNKFIYTSRTERGLSILLELWPHILEYLPDAQLVISTYTKFPSNQDEERIKTIIDKYDSVKHLGKLNTEQLYLEMSSSEYWLYPSIYPETSCITALEMLMSEVICLYYPYAGLPYTMKEHGIQIEKGNEIDKLISLTIKQKRDLRINGKKYAESCSWEERGKLWSEMLSLNVNVNINTTIQKTQNVAIFNSFEFHYELFAHIINYCNKNNFKLTIFTRTTWSFGWHEYYKKQFNTYQFEYKTISDFESIKNTFDIIFVPTDDDPEIKPEWVNDKYISLNHTCNIRRPLFNNYLWLRPYHNYNDIENNQYAIPCYDLVAPQDKINMNDDCINIAVLGGLYKQLNYEIINRLATDEGSNKKIKLYIIGRHYGEFTTESFRKDFIVSVYTNINTEQMFILLKQCDYIFTDTSKNNDHIIGKSMSGNVPLAFTTLTPLIISQDNNKMYQFKNVIEFDINSTDKIIVRKGMINIKNLVKERSELMIMFDNYVNNIIGCNIETNTNTNTNTALIVEPRNIHNLDKLINDYKTKLGDKWNIVFYCGKSLKSKWSNTLLDPSIEIRELDVNNFTLEQYSDFFKSKKLWEALDGEYVLTFQADTFILNKAQYNIDYFVNMNKSYIGGNMSYNWNELNRENLFIENRNFNGGLSLRKRCDMIKIIDSFGVSKTVRNSNNFLTDAEDVYFTLGCYKLNMPIGDTKSCQHFALHTIYKSEFFGIHNPDANIIEQIKSRQDMSLFFDYPKSNKWWIYAQNYNTNVLAEYSTGLKTKYNIEFTDNCQLILDSKPDMVSFVFGINDSFYNQLQHMHPQCVVSLLNLEPLNLLERKMYVISNYNAYNQLKIYDYSLSNIHILKDNGVTNVEHLPYIVTDAERQMLTDLNSKTNKLYDFGILTGSGAPNNSINELGPKRQQLVRHLLDKGFSVNIIKGWGLERDVELSKCNVILNIHGQLNSGPDIYEDSMIFEHIRCDRLLTAGYNILSETCENLESNYTNKYSNNLKIINFQDFFSDANIVGDWLQEKKNQLTDTIDRTNIDINKRKIVDCFIFYNELEMLKYRLHVLNDFVDYFIIVEARQTHVGANKPLFFNENKHLFEKFSSKIIHVVVDLLFTKDTINISNGDQWTNEKYQRNCIDQGIKQIKSKIKPEDLIIIADLDEIPDPEILKQIKDSSIILINGISCFEQDFYYYNLNSKRNEKWYHSKILTFKKYNELAIECSDIRFFHCNVLVKGGWHLSYFGDSQFIKNKLENFAHQEYNSSKFTDPNEIQKKIDNQLDLFGRPGNNDMKRVEIKDNDYLPPLYDTYLQSFYDDINPKQVKKYCFIHSCTFLHNGTLVLDKLVKLIKSTGLIDILDKIFINNIGEPIQHNYGNKFIVTNYSKNKLLYETPTINKIKQFVDQQTDKEPCYILYLHTKGNSYVTENQQVTDWTNMMLYFLVEKYKTCFDKLDLYDVIGCNYQLDPSPHFAGNFWWAKSSHINTLELLDETSEECNKHAPEFWLLKNNDENNNSTIYCSHSSDKYHRYTYCYPRERYASE
jgi:beta-1,4-mannosyl-glycoprotein beta-1,4-N-acetylglucosaminyltransferase